MYVPAPAIVGEETAGVCVNICLTLRIGVFVRRVGRAPVLDLFEVETPVPADPKRWNLVAFQQTMDRRTGHAQIVRGLLERHQRF